MCRFRDEIVNHFQRSELEMPKLIKKAARGPRFSAAAAKYDAHHTVLSKTYGALADLRRELADSKPRQSSHTTIPVTMPAIQSDCNRQ